MYHNVTDVLESDMTTISVREARLRWFRRVQRRDSEYSGRRMLRMELPGRRSRGRPKSRFMDGVKEDVKVVGVREDDVENGARWRQMSRCDDSFREKLKGKEDVYVPFTSSLYLCSS